MKLNTPENRIKYLEKEIAFCQQDITEKIIKIKEIKNNSEKWEKENKENKENNRNYWNSLSECLTWKNKQLNLREHTLNNWFENHNNHIYNYIYQIK